MALIKPEYNNRYSVSQQIYIYLQCLLAKLNIFNGLQQKPRSKSVSEQILPMNNGFAIVTIVLSFSF